MIGAQEITVDLSQVYDPRRNGKQLLFHRAPETYKLFGGAMGGGKTAALINEGIALNFDYPGNFGLLMRKTWPSFRDTVLPQLEHFLDRRLIRDWNRSEKLIVYWNGSRVRYGGVGEHPDDWQKFMSGEYGWIALDQAEEFTEHEFLMLATRLRLNLPGLRPFFLLSCNPTDSWIKQRFIESSQPDHIFIPSFWTDNIANLPAGYIERMKQILPVELQDRYLRGDWSGIADPLAVFPCLKVKEAMERKVERGLPVVIGVDVARGGDDESVLALREGGRLEIFSQAQGHDTMRTTGEVWRCVQERILPAWGKALSEVTVQVDAIGLGSGVVDRLREVRKEKEAAFREQGFEIAFRIIEIIGSARARNRSRFRNLRAEVHWGAREALDWIELPGDSELSRQLLGIKYRLNSAGLIEIEPKEEIKKRLKKSPDRAEAVIYALAEVKPKGVGHVCTG